MNLVDILDFFLLPPLYPIYPFISLALPLNYNLSLLLLSIFIAAVLVQATNISHKEYYSGLPQSLFLSLYSSKIHSSHSCQVDLQELKFGHVTPPHLEIFQYFSSGTLKTLAYKVLHDLLTFLTLLHTPHPSLSTPSLYKIGISLTQMSNFFSPQHLCNCVSSA